MRLPWGLRWWELTPEAVLGGGLLLFLLTETSAATSALESRTAVVLMAVVGAAWLAGRVLLVRFTRLPGLRLAVFGVAAVAVLAVVVLPAYDDTKPFSLEEVVARLQVILRRQGVGTSSSRLVLADLEMDDDAHLVRRSGQAIDLSPTEYNLLRFLLLNAGRVLSRNQILDHVWQYDFGGHATVVETYVSYLRKKIDTLGPPLIHTVRGVGYTARVS